MTAEEPEAAQERTPTQVLLTHSGYEPPLYRKCQWASRSPRSVYYADRRAAT